MNSTMPVTLEHMSKISQVWINEALYINNKIYIFAASMNRLIELDLADNKVSDLGKIPGEHWFKEDLTCKLIAWQESIIIVPWMARGIWIYSLAGHTWEFFPLKNFCRDQDSGSNLREAVLVDTSLFLFGGRYPAIVQFDLVTKEITYITEPFQNYIAPNGMLQELFTRNGYVRKLDCLYFASALTNAVFCFNVKDMTWQWIEIGRKENRYAAIAWDGAYFWLSPRMNTSIAKWDGENEVVEYDLLLEQRKPNYLYFGIWEIEGRLVLPAVEGRGSDTIVIDTTGRLTFYKDSYIFFKAFDGYGYIFQDKDGNIGYSVEPGAVSHISSQVLSKSFAAYLIQNADAGEESFFTNSFIGESDVIDLNVFIKLVIDSCQNGERKINGRENTGFKLFYSE